YSPLPLLLFFFQPAGAPRALHSFPTRRSSDLPWPRPRPNARPSAPPSSRPRSRARPSPPPPPRRDPAARSAPCGPRASPPGGPRSEEHTSELQSLTNLVCRLLLEKKQPRLHIL